MTGRLAHLRFALLLAIAASAVLLLVQSAHAWRDARGWEYEWIASALAQGHGFSFPGDHRHLFDHTNPEDHTDPAAFYATAWMEPIPTYLLAIFFRLFEDHGRLAMLVGNVVFFGMTIIIVYRIGCRVAGAAVGLLAALLLMVIDPPRALVVNYIGNSLLAGLLIALCCLLMLWWMDHVSVRRGLALGTTIGIAALTHTAALIFAPLAVLLMFSARKPFRLKEVGAGCVLLLAATVVISPWTIRNYLTFGELVPVRAGFGNMAYVGNRATAETFNPDLVDEQAALQPPWAASGAIDAIWRQGNERRRALFSYADATVRAIEAERYSQLNEAQRDQVFLEKTLAFTSEHPGIVLQLMAVRAVKFLYMDRATFLLGLGALVGGIAAVRNRRARAIALMVAAYSVPYVASFPYFYRYRYPIEPLVAVLAAMGLMWVANWAVTVRFREWVWARLNVWWRARRKEA